IDPSVKPVEQPLRRIPFNLRGAVERKIKELVDMDIIEPAKGPTPWVNPVVIVPKANSEIRLCLDMRQANRAIVRERYPIPTVDEILQGVNGSTIFSKLNLKWGYHQLELSPESREITTFAVHNGVYRYKRLIFSVSSASEQSQHEIANALAGIDGVENISDDVIVHAGDQETHDQRLHMVMERLSERGLTLNPEKCQFNMSKLIFMGILLSEKGIGPTEERVRAVREAREPKTASEVRSFLGLVGYSSRFIEQFATLSEPLRRLTKKEIQFEALALAHEGHLGIVGTKQHLRSKVWRPGMDKAAEKYCKSCHGCQVVSRPDAPEPLRPTTLPDGPWQDVAIDLLGPFPTGHSILVVVDYYSRYYEYEILTSTISDKIIDSLESIFSRHGLPITCRSDQGPQFKSEQFTVFCESNGIKHQRTTPKWAQANGEVERQNSSIMKRIQIAQAEGLDWKKELRKYVSAYRSIEHPTTGKSPAELLFNRKI
ncbi:hypothetical protein HF521_018070, partial [Silurus meridionalis]